MIEKISFEQVRRKDLSLLKKWRNAHEIWKFNMQYTLLNSKNQDEWFTRLNQKTNSKMFIVSTNNEIIAICGFVKVEDKNASVAIIIGNKKFRGKGIGKNILKRLLEIGFNNLNYNRIEAEIIEYNINSIKFFESMNFIFECRYREALWRNGKWNDVLVYSILKNDFKKL